MRIRTGNRSETLTCDESLIGRRHSYTTGTARTRVSRRQLDVSLDVNPEIACNEDIRPHRSYDVLRYHPNRSCTIQTMHTDIVYACAMLRAKAPTRRQASSFPAPTSLFLCDPAGISAPQSCSVVEKRSASLALGIGRLAPCRNTQRQARDSGNAKAALHLTSPAPSLGPRALRAPSAA